MTIDQAVHKIARHIDAIDAGSRDRDELLLLERGASEDELAAALAARDEIWRQFREHQLAHVRSELEGFVFRDGGSLH